MKKLTVLSLISWDFLVPIHKLAQFLGVLPRDIQPPCPLVSVETSIDSPKGKKPDQLTPHKFTTSHELNPSHAVIGTPYRTIALEVSSDKLGKQPHGEPRQTKYITFSFWDAQPPYIFNQAFVRNKKFGRSACVSEVDSPITQNVSQRFSHTRAAWRNADLATHHTPIASYPTKHPGTERSQAPKTTGKRLTLTAHSLIVP